MNILVLCDGFVPEHTGGICRSLFTEVQDLAERGHSLTVLTRRHQAASPEEERHSHYRLVRHPGPLKGTKAYYAHPWVTMRTVPRVLRKMAAREPYDLAYVHNTFHAAALARSGLKIPRVWSFHAPAPVEIALDAAQGKYGPLAPVARTAVRAVDRIERRSLQAMDKVFARSDFMKSEIERLYPNVAKPSVVPLGVDTKRFAPAADRAEVRRSLDLPTDRPIILTVRRLVGRMGLEELIRAMRPVATDHPGALLLIAGRGYLEASLKELVEKEGLTSSVRFLGFVSDEDLPRFYQAADLFVLPTSNLEGFGLVTLEAMSCGTPVIATPVGANPAIVGGFDADLVTQDPSSCAIAECVGAWLKRGVTDTMRDACREHCVTRYSRETIGTALEELFNEVRIEVHRGA
jgi:glycosyltransferase involved in cell wall biosynthesis